MKRGTPTHTKVGRLMRRLNIRRYHAVGLLEMLWHLSARQAERGDIGKLSDEEIAIDFDWEGEPSHLIGGLVDCGWLDPHPEHRLVVHDWHDHADDATKKRVERSGKPFLSIGGQRHPTADIGRQRQPALAEPSRAIAEPEPLPEPSPLAADNGKYDFVAATNALIGVGFNYGAAHQLVGKYRPPLESVENYCARAMTPGINNRPAFVTSCIKDVRPVEPIAKPEAAVGRKQAVVNAQVARLEAMAKARKNGVNP